MAGLTELNPSLEDGAITQVNREVDAVEEYNRQHHIETPAAAGMPDIGTELLGKYRITGRMEIASGEADLYLCTCASVQYVAKIYRRKVAVKSEVTEALRKITSPYVARLYDSGTWSGLPVEILPYYKLGSIQGSVFREMELRDTVIPDINEGLHALHQAGILHKDLKPANLMRNDDGRTVSIIDFGISSATDPGNMLRITQTGMTPEYSAPETFRGVYYPGSDYYSLGITLYELLIGYTPYANMAPDEIARMMLTSKVVFPDSVSKRFRDLIQGLTYPDITNRDDPKNPNRRWTYDEVKRWLAGEVLPIPGSAENAGQGGIRPFRFAGKEYTDVPSLVRAMTMQWSEGKKALFGGELTAYFRAFDSDLAGICLAAEEQAERESGQDDVIFWETLYRIGPQLREFYWQGRVYAGLPALGREVLENAWERKTGMNAYYDSILRGKLISRYVQLFSPGNEKLKQAAKLLEDSYELEQIEGTNMLRTYYRMGYILSGQKIYRVRGEKFTTVGEFANYMKQLYGRNKRDFMDLCHDLMTYQGTINDEQLEVWLESLGKRGEMDSWRELMEK